MVVLLLAVGPLAACSTSSSKDGAAATSTTGGCRSVAQGRVTITAKDLAWDSPCILAKVGTEVIVKVVNDDTGVNHDFHLKDAPGNPSTPLSKGPSSHQLEVALAQGTYHYVCDVHPAMVGELRVG